jgi:hypothetical protein
LGFTSYQGFSGRVVVDGQYNVDMAHPEGLETWVYEENLQTAFIDFTEINDNELSNQSFQMKGYFHIPSYDLPWAKIYDGIVYIEDMYLCSKVND